MSRRKPGASLLLRVLPVAWGLLVMAKLLADASDAYVGLRERAFDSLLRLASSEREADRIAIVDIDRRSLQALGPWPWSRERIAALVDAAAASHPKVLCIDILIAGPDERSPAALARRLSLLTNNDAVQRLAGELADGDALLSAAIAKVPTALGVGLDPENAGDTPARAQILVKGDLDTSGFWEARGTIGPDPPVATTAAAFGTLALPGDADGNVRRAPLLTLADGQLVPGLAIEAVRLAEQATALLVAAEAGRIRIGQTSVPLEAAGMLRLLPPDAGHWARRTVAAAKLMKGEVAAENLAGRIVLFGSSAPELGGLRSTGAGLTPSVHLQADAVRQILSGEAPTRPIWIRLAEYVAVLLVSAGAIAAGLALGPLAGSVSVLLASLAWWMTAAVAATGSLLLVDPIFVPAVAVAAFAAASLTTAAGTLRREALIRRRFEQHLAPEVVRRIVERPDLLKLEGELREVTAMFTDIEGFTAMTERSDARLLVAVLDRYFEGVTQRVVDHGGMIDKIVGDGVHALFNAPLDLADHTARAVACATAIVDYAEKFREGATAAALGFGRTRIGIETGEVVIGDVGGGRKLDYTAHGNAVNAAARLEAANKDLGSVVCIGPTAAARLDPSSLRPLGPIAIRGRSMEACVFDIWPAEYSPADRETYLGAIELAEKSPAEAARLFNSLTGIAASDRVVARSAERCAARG